MEASAHRAQVLTIGRSGMEQSTRSGCADAFASCLHHGAPAYRRREPAESVCRNAARLAGEGQVETRRDPLRCAHRTWKRAHNASAAAARSLEEARRSQGLAGARASRGVRRRRHPGDFRDRPGGRYLKYRPPLGLVPSVRCDVGLFLVRRSSRWPWRASPPFAGDGLRGLRRSSAAPCELRRLRRHGVHEQRIHRRWPSGVAGTPARHGVRRRWRSRDPAVAFGSRRRSGEPWRAAEMAFSRPRGVDGVWDTVRVDGI